MAEELAAWMAERLQRICGSSTPITMAAWPAGTYRNRGCSRDRGGTNFAKANFNFTIRDQQAANPSFGADSGDVLAIPDAESAVRVPYQPDSALAFATFTMKRAVSGRDALARRSNAPLGRSG